MKALKILFAFILFTTIGYSQKINFRHIGLNEGLPQLSVMSIWSDDLDQMWFATRRGIFIFDGHQMLPLEIKRENGKKERFLRAQYLSGDKKGNVYFVNDDELIRYNKYINSFTSFGRNIYSISLSDCNLWATNKRTVFYLDTLSQKLQVFKKLQNFPDSKIICIHENKLKQLWVGLDKGLIIIDKHKKEQIILSGLNVNHLFEDKSRNLWVSTSKGLYCIKPDFTIVHYIHDDSNSNSLLSNSVRVVNQDLEGNIWIGTIDGVNKFEPALEKFTAYLADNTNNSISHNSIRSIHCDRSANIWIGSFMGGVNYFNTKSQILKFIGLESANIKNLEPINLIYPLSRDLFLFSSYNSGSGIYNLQKNTTTSINPKGQRLIIKCGVYNAFSNKFYFVGFDHGLFTFDLKTYSLKTIDFKKNTVDSKSFEKMVAYKDRIYLTNMNGVFVLNTINNSLTPILQKVINGKSTPIKLMIDSKQRLWIISLGSEIDCLNLINNRFSINKQFFPKESLQQTIRISNIFEDSKSRIWLTTFGKGLYMLNEKTNRFEEFANESNGLISDFCFDIKEGLNSNLVVFESNGLTIIDVENFKFTHFPKNQLPSDKIMTEINEYYIDSEANIFIGTMNGIVLLNQIDLPSEITQSKLFFSHLYLNSEEVFPNDGSNILTQALPYCSKIRFSSKNRNFDIDISNTNYLKINGSQIEYILDGFEKQWNKTTSNRIHYTNIKPGNYVLKVRLFNTKSNLQNEISLPVEIYPPFYASTFAYILYFLLLALIAVYILRIVESKRLLKHSLEFEKKEKQRIEELDNAKVKFYINISHEFRTPISLIKAQIETILDNQNNLNPLFKSALQRVLKNTDRLQNLVSEILDFRKLELGKMKLKINRCNIIEQLAEAIDTFKEGINRNGIKLRFENSKTELFLYLDVKLIMSAINNLLNNAFKFTLENGEVIVSVEEDSENVYIHFSDTGIGIPEEHIDKVFDRFYQAPNATTNFGSGIGLSFVKDIVENHGGEITVRNNDNSGCKFTLKFRKGFEHFSANDLSPEVLYPEVEGGTILFENEQIDIEPSIVDNENSILIVEDNKEMLNLLAEIFSPLYQVKTAEDGEVAIEILKTIQPDLILSDVMMTKVSGIELCSYVKSNYEYCHIPVVLLTAKNLDENKIEGLQTGADDYIVKPFNTKLLITRCNNIINNRKILQEKFAKQIDYSPKIVATNEFDVKFINQAYEVIEKNLANFDFDVDVFCKEMYMSRVKLYNKIQGLTGMTIKDFIQNIKLKKAADYLVNRPDLLITDITYMLGFSSPRYFSKSFKGLFGIIPSEYRQKHNIKSDEEIVE